MHDATRRRAAELRHSIHAAILWTGHCVESRLHRRVAVEYKFAGSAAPSNRCPLSLRHRGWHARIRLLVVQIVAVKPAWLPVYCAGRRGAQRLRAGGCRFRAASGQGGGAWCCGAERLRASVCRFRLKSGQGGGAWCCGEDGHALEHAGDDLQADKEVVLAAVARNGWALQYAAAEIRADKEVVCDAVAQHGGALRHASLDLQADKEVVAATAVYPGRRPRDYWF